MTGLNPKKPNPFNTFQNKILLAFIICSIVPLAAIGVFAYDRSSMIAKESIQRSVVFTSRQIGQMISERMNRMEQVADATQYLLYQLNMTSDQPFTGFLDKYVETRGSISSLVNASNLYSVNVFVEGESILSQDGLMFSPIRNLETYGFTESEVLDLIRSNRRGWTVLNDVPVLRVPIQPGKRETLISCIWGKYNINLRKLDYVYFVNLQVFVITDLLEGNLENGITRLLISENGKIIASASSAAQSQKSGLAVFAESEIYDESPMINSTGYTHEYTIPVNGWRLITVVDHSYIQERIKGLVNIYLLAVFFILLALIIAIVILSKNLTKKIYLLANAMRTYKISRDNTEWIGISASVNVPVEKRDEIDEITVDFIEMANRLEANYQQLLTAKIEEEKLKYQLLHAKINPHFLYNILESIKTCQSLGDVKTANLMITKLGRFYRKQLNISAEPILLTEELTNVSEYLDIENHCRLGKIHLSIEMDPGLEALMIPPFTLQPIVENAIRHGLKGPGIDLNISIKVISEEDWIRIVIADDGIGISPNELIAIKERLSVRTAIRSPHFGLRSLNAKLSIFNNDSESENISIVSEPNRGTVVTIRIEPTISEEEPE